MLREASQRGGRRWRWVGRGCKTHREKSEQVNGNKAAARSIPTDSHPATGWGWCSKQRNKECRLHLSEKNKIRGLFSPMFLFWEPSLPCSPQQCWVWLTQAMLISPGGSREEQEQPRHEPCPQSPMSCCATSGCDRATTLPGPPCEPHRDKQGHNKMLQPIPS